MTTLSHLAKVASAAARVLVATGRGVAVGYGTFSFCPTTRLLHEAGRLFKMIMLVADTPKVIAIPPQVSPAATVYSNGGCMVEEGTRVGSCVAVGVSDGASVSVWVGTSVGFTTRFVALNPA